MRAFSLSGRFRPAAASCGHETSPDSALAPGAACVAAGARATRPMRPLRLAAALLAIAGLIAVAAGSAKAATGSGYTAVSNVMKTKHDTVKNTISNVR